MKKICNFLIKLLVGDPTVYTDPGCPNCESKNIRHIRDSCDGFYAEFRCRDCREKFTL